MNDKKKMRLKERFRKCYRRGVSQGRSIERKINERAASDNSKTSAAILRQRDTKYIGEIAELNKSIKTEKEELKKRLKQESRERIDELEAEIAELKQEIKNQKADTKKQLKEKDKEIEKDQAEIDKLHREQLQIKHWLADKMELLKSFVSNNRATFEYSKKWRTQLRDSLIHIGISEDEFKRMERDVRKIERSMEKDGVFKGIEYDKNTLGGKQ